MIDTNELRKLTQSATPGPWKILPVGDGRQKFAVADRKSLSILTVTDEGEATFGTVYDDADARFIAAANPAAISELLDSLEAAEKERDALRAKMAKMAKMAEMEQQEPVAWADAFGEPFRKKSEIDGVASPLYALPGAQEQEPARLVTPTAYRWRRRGSVMWQYGELTEETVRLAKEHNHEVQSLYALPGAKGEEE